MGPRKKSPPPPSRRAGPYGGYLTELAVCVKHPGEWYSIREFTNRSYAGHVAKCLREGRFSIPPETKLADWEFIGRSYVPRGTAGTSELFAKYG